MRGYLKRHAVSNYDGFKELETMQERIAEGDLAPRIKQMGARMREPNADFLCEVCKTRKRNFKLVRVKAGLAMLGKRVPGMRGHYISACESCAESLTRKVS